MEVLISTDEDESTESKTSINFWNPSSETKILSLRGPPALPTSLLLIRDEGVLISELGKPFIHLWPVLSNQSQSVSQSQSLVGLTCD